MLRKTTSLIMLLSFFIMGSSGMMLFIAPEGRISNWANWSVLSITREQWGEIHTAFMVLFLVFGVLHTYYNWKPILFYLKNKTGSLVIFTKEFAIALIATLAFFFGTLYDVVPFSSLFVARDDIRDISKSLHGEPPFGHAELASLESFCKKMGFELENSLKTLNEKKITVNSPKETLKDIGKRNGVSPNEIYTILLEADISNLPVAPKEPTGLGKKKIKDLSSLLGLDEQEVTMRLKKMGIDASGETKLKELAEILGKTPEEIIEELKK